MQMLNEKVRGELKKVLEMMKDSVSILFFSQELECGICDETNSFLSEFASLNDKIRLTVFDFMKNQEKAKFYGVDKIPAIVLLDKNDNDTRIKFYGIPAGYEINSFVSALLEVSGVKTSIPDDITKKIMSIDKKTHIEVFISLTCPYCPDAVRMAHRIALENSNVTADMVDSGVFTPLAIKHNVTSVPKTIINGKKEIIGLQTFDDFILSIQNA